MKKAIFTIILAALTATQAGAFRLFDNLTYNLRFGYSIGGTAPMGMPATIRSLDKFTLTPNFNLGLGVYRDFNEHWGLTTGLYLENKGMKVESTVKNYHMAFVRGNQRLEGNFTGGVSIDVEQWMLTLPLLATYAVNNNLHIKLGPYLSYVRSHKFTGDAYGGYIRVGDPTGQKVYIGTEKGSRGTYDFSSTSTGACSPTCRGASPTSSTPTSTPSSRTFIPFMEQSVLVTELNNQQKRKDNL